MNNNWNGDMTVLSTSVCKKPFRRVTFSLLVLTFLTACVGAEGDSIDENEAIVVSDNEATIKLAMPRSIVSRKIEADEYALTLSVNDIDVAMVRVGESWSGETFVPFGTELNVNLDWSAQGIPLASLSKNYGSAASSNNISISSADYTYIDSDNDQLSNFAELNAEPASNPYDADSPADPEVVVATDTSAISGVYKDTLITGDEFAVFISDSGGYEILDNYGDAYDGIDDCWYLEERDYRVENIGEGFYVFDVSTFMEGGRYFVSRDEDSTRLYLESTSESLEWEIVQAFHTDADEYLDEDDYCSY